MLSRYLLLPIMGVAMTFLSLPLQAQPAAVETPKTANPANAKDAMADAQAQVQRMMKMTPQEMRREILKLEEQQLKTFLTATGFNDLELQDTLWNFVLDQEEARTEIRRLSVQLRELAANPKADEVAVATQFAAYQQALDIEKARRADSARDMTEALRLETRPRLKALLSLLGYVDDTPWLIGDTAALGLMAIGTAQMAVIAQAKAAPQKVEPTQPAPPAAQ